MTRLAPLLALLLAAPAVAQDRPLTLGPPIDAAGPKVTLPATKRVLPGERFAIAPVVTNGGTPRLLLPDSGLKEDRTFVDLLPTDVQAQLKGWVLYAPNPGVYRAYSFCGGPNNSSSDAALCVITVGDPPPPGPTPGPTPPTPPGPAPIPGDGLRVLVVTETSDLAKLPSAQVTVLTAADVWAYLRSHCAKDANGQPAFRFWDKDVSPDLAPEPWKTAMKRDRKSLPWVVISTGKDGYEGPLPATVADTLALLRKYGGQ